MKLIKMLKEILAGVGILALSAGTVVGISANCKREIDRHFPLVEQNLSEARTEFKEGNYDKVREIRKNTFQLLLDLDQKGGEWYYFLFERGRQIYSMYKDIKGLEETTSILREKSPQEQQ